jgi:hypothetical protein
VYDNASYIFWAYQYGTDSVVLVTRSVSWVADDYVNYTANIHAARALLRRNWDLRTCEAGAVFNGLTPPLRLVSVTLTTRNSCMVATGSSITFHKKLSLATEGPLCVTKADVGNRVPRLP